MATKIAVLLLLACVGYTAAQAPAMPDLTAIPQECMASGASLQTECASTFTEAQAFFNIQPGQVPPPGAISQEQITKYLAQAKPPSPGCCKIACDFNNAFCSCEKTVLDFASQLAGNADVFTTIGAAFAQVCKFKAFIGSSCPAPQLRATTVKDACMAAPAAAALPAQGR